jgi:hypothetical protein
VADSGEALIVDRVLFRQSFERLTDQTRTAYTAALAEAIEPRNEVVRKL